MVKNISKIKNILLLLVITLIVVSCQKEENPAESFDLALTTVFNNFEDLATYAAHPDHVAAAAIFKAVAAGRACVDYTF